MIEHAGRLVGLITIKDLLKYIARKEAKDAADLNDDDDDDDDGSGEEYDDDGNNSLRLKSRQKKHVIQYECDTIHECKQRK